MKTFRTVGSGSTQTIEPIENNKIPVYETKTAAETDLANLEVGQIIATEDEGNELSNPGDVVQDGNMHAVTRNAVADAISYSTNEVKTGGKWIDGKPIYRKVVDFGALAAGSKTVAHGISNLGDIIHISGVARSADNTSLPLPYASSVPVILYVNTTYVVVEISNNNYAGYTRSEITIEYTKTTD